MSVWGKIIGGTAGFAIGGPIGAILGVMAGNLFDKSKRLVYRGRLDSSSPGNGEKINGEDFRTALDLCIEGKKINSIQYPSMGCNIKWK